LYSLCHRIRLSSAGYKATYFAGAMWESLASFGASSGASATPCALLVPGRRLAKQNDTEFILSPLWQHCHFFDIDTHHYQ
jgi:hypothetical protein